MVLQAWQLQFESVKMLWIWPIYAMKSVELRLGWSHFHIEHPSPEMGIIDDLECLCGNACLRLGLIRKLLTLLLCKISNSWLTKLHWKLWLHYILETQILTRPRLFVLTFAIFRDIALSGNQQDITRDRLSDKGRRSAPSSGVPQASESPGNHQPPVAIRHRWASLYSSTYNWMCVLSQCCNNCWVLSCAISRFSCRIQY